MAHLVMSLEPKEVRGSLFIYSAPRTFCTPINWAISEMFKSEVQLDWKTQELLTNNFSCEFNWIGPTGICARIVSNLSRWGKLRLEAFQEPVNNLPGERFAVTPELGIYRAEINLLGETLLTESKIKSGIDRAKLEGETLESELSFLLGKPWDDDLEPFRSSFNGTIIRWISKTG
jgi:hypothetical protein